MTTPAFSMRCKAFGTPGTTAMARCSMAPAATLVTVGVTWAARWRGTTTPVTPAHSALRSSEPRLWGSVTPSRTTRNGDRARAGRTESSSSTLHQGRGPGQHPLGGLGAGLGSRAGVGRPRADGRDAGPPDARCRRAAARARGPRPSTPRAPGGDRRPVAPARPGGPRPGHPRVRGRRPGPGRPRVSGRRPGVGAPARPRPGRSRRRGRGCRAATGRRPTVRGPGPATGGAAHGPTTRATARQAMPFDPPEGTETLGPRGLHAHRCARATAPRRRPMSSVCSASRGRSHTTVQSAFTTRMPWPRHHGHHPGQQGHGVGPGPRRIGVGEVTAQVAEAGRPEQGVGQGVGHRRRRRCGRPVRPRRGWCTPPEDEGAAGVPREAVDVEALADAQRARPSAAVTTPPGPGPCRDRRGWSP